MSTEALYAGAASDIKIIRQTERDIAKELDSSFDPQKVVDSFEEAQGVRPKKEKKKNIKSKCFIFDMAVKEDQELFEKLINSPKYQIIYKKDSFSTRGDYKMFCIYNEDLDYVEPKTN